MIDSLLYEYNRTIHSIIKMRPIDVKDDRLLHTVYKRLKNSDSTPNIFKVGDIVRISKYKDVFEKGYTANWSTKHFKIRNIVDTNPRTILLEDMKGKPITGGFYGKELRKTLFPDVYLVEKIIRRSGDIVYVKWLGFDSTYNSWIDAKDIV